MQVRISVEMDGRTVNVSHPFGDDRQPASCKYGPAQFFAKLLAAARVVVQQAAVQTEQQAVSTNNGSVHETRQEAPPVTPRVWLLLECCVGEMTSSELKRALGRIDMPTHFQRLYLKPAVEQRLVEKTGSGCNQVYRLTDLGREVLASKTR